MRFHTAGSESPARGSRPFWGIARFSLPGLSELTVVSFAREPGIRPGRTAWELCEPGAGRGEVSLQNSQAALLALRAEEDDSGETARRGKDTRMPVGGVPGMGAGWTPVHRQAVYTLSPPASTKGAERIGGSQLPAGIKPGRRLSESTVEESDLEALVGSMLLGVSGGVMVIGLIVHDMGARVGIVHEAMVMKRNLLTEIRKLNRMLKASHEQASAWLSERDTYRVRATKAEQEVAEWKKRFDALLARTPDQKS